MSAYLVTYDLRKPGGDYADLIASIKAFGNWAHILESVWMIVTNQSPTAVRDALRAKMDNNDGLIVAYAGASAWAGLGTEVSDWLKANL